MRKGEKEAVEKEIEKILTLMDIHSFSVSLSKDDWRSLTRIFLKACQLRFEGSKPDEWQENALSFLQKEIELNEEESVSFDLFNN